MSAEPSSGAINPYPLSALNHFTLPCAICLSPSMRTYTNPRGRAGGLPAVRPRERSQMTKRPRLNSAGAFTFANFDYNRSPQPTPTTSGIDVRGDIDHAHHAT